MNDATGQLTPPPRAASTVHFNLFDEEDVLAARPTPLVEVRPQRGVQRHTAEQIIETFVPVQVLDAPVPQMEGEQVVEFMRKLDALALDEQVIAVPKISFDRVSKRFPRRRTRKADQLVEVPTIISYSSLQQRTLEQIVDIPVPQGRVGRGGLGVLQGVSQRQGSPSFRGAEFVDIPVPPGRGGSGGGGLQSFSQGQGSTAFYGADHADFPVPPCRVGGGGLQGFLPGQGSASSSHVGSAQEAGQGVFRTFPLWKKSAGLGPHSGTELGADFTPWTPAAYAESMAGAYVEIAESEAEAEAEAEAEMEDAAARFAAGFRPLWVCTQFLQQQLGWPGWGCAYGDRCTFAHSWAELHPEASAHEQQLASHLPD